MNFIFTITYLVAAAAALVLADNSYHKVELEPNGEPFPGLRTGNRSEVLPQPSPSKKFGVIRIVDGKYATLGQFPYYVGIVVGFGNNVYTFCGGTLIGNEWILTAAHCTSGGKTFEIRLGSINSEKPLKVSYGIQNHVHPNWGKKNGDIALVKIQWVDYNANIAPAALTSLNGVQNQFVNSRVVAIGFGATDNNGTRGDKLKYVVNSVMDPQACANFYGDNAKDPAIMCTSTIKGVGGTCSGDSGGPLVLENTRILVGCSAFGAAGACGTGFPDGFSRLTYYLKWIKDISGISF